ncbi:MAG: hypothetical protein J1E33_02715 [Alistipes sp.]|nr:hypothetical protein [Alistipes sp.]
MIIILCSTAAVGLFVIALSLTLMIKGHHIESDISTNPNMRRLGIKCPVREARENMHGDDCDDPICSGACSSCDIQHSDR